MAESLATARKAPGPPLDYVRYGSRGAYHRIRAVFERPRVRRKPALELVTWCGRHYSLERGIRSYGPAESKVCKLCLSALKEGAE